MQTGKTSFHSANFIEQSSMQLRINQEKLPMLHKGDIVKVSIGHVIQGKSQVIIQGQSITLEGISKQLEHTNITLKIIQTQPIILLELKNNAKAIENLKKSENSLFNTSEKAISSKKTALKMQKNIQKNQEFSVHTKPALSISLKEKQHAYQATAIAKHESSTTLHISSHNPSHSIHNKHIQITSPTRPIQLGEQFNIQKIDHLGTSSKLLLEPLETLKSSASNQSIHTSSIANLGALAPGKVITASVEQRLPSGHIILNWQQQRFEAASPEHVRVGDVLQLEVNRDNQKDRPSLRVLNLISQPKNKAAQLLRQHIGNTDTTQQTLHTLQKIHANNTPTNNQAIKQSLASLQSWTDHYALNPEKGMDGSSLASLMRQIGQHYESSLLQHRHASIEQLQQLQQHDLKALLLQLSDHVANLKTTVESTLLKHTAERGLARIESQQALNLLAMIQADPIRFELPMMVQGQWMNVLLSIQQDMYDKSNTNNQAQNISHHILFALDLSNLGALRVDAHISDASVHARFYHENDDSRRFIQENIQHLQEKLKNIGFNDIYLNSAEIKQLTPATSLQFQQLIDHAPSSDGLLDIQA